MRGGLGFKLVFGFCQLFGIVYFLFIVFSCVDYQNIHRFKRVNQGPVYSAFMGKVISLTDEDFVYLDDKNDRDIVMSVTEFSGRYDDPELSPYEISTTSGSGSVIQVLPQADVAYKIIDIYRIT